MLGLELARVRYFGSVVRRAPLMRRWRWRPWFCDLRHPGRGRASRRGTAIAADGAGGGSSKSNALVGPLLPRACARTDPHVHSRLRNDCTRSTASGGAGACVLPARLLVRPPLSWPRPPSRAGAALLSTRSRAACRSSDRRRRGSRRWRRSANRTVSRRHVRPRQRTGRGLARAMKLF